MKSNYEHFITIYRDLYETYFTNTYNSLVIECNEKSFFDSLCKDYNHSKKCLLTILSNIIVSIHFNIDRSTLNCDNMDTYITSLKNNITNTLLTLNITKFFDHECDLDIDNNMQQLNSNKKL